MKATGDGASLTFNSRAKGETAETGRITLELRENGLLIDRLIVKDGGEPLEKLTLRENGTKICATQDNQDMAVLVIASDSEAIQKNEQPVNFKAAKNGTYTLTVIVENMDLDYLHLIDNLTGADVDLLGDAGTASLQVVDVMGRVIVSVGGHTRCVPTGGGRDGARGRFA